MKVLLIEDDPTLNRNIHAALSAENMLVQSVYDGNLAERMLVKETFDCIIMDINLPGVNGFELARTFRQTNKYTPILMLTAFGELEDKVKGFDSGADDYLTKPFFMRELIIRVQALAKRNSLKNHGNDESKIIIAGDIKIDVSRKQVWRQGKEITLTPREYQILVKLCHNVGEVVSKNDLINEIWGGKFDANTNTIEVYINFLRNKIDKPFQKSSIKTKIGFGYYFENE